MNLRFKFQYEFKSSMSSKIGIALIIDESGSMESIKDKVITSINSFLQEQRQYFFSQNYNLDPRVTLVTFNNQINLKGMDVPLNDIKFENYNPSGTTALNDAIGETINRLSLMRYTKVIVCIVTDGMENASKKFTRNYVSEMITEFQQKGWNFVYLCTSFDDFNKGSLINQGNSLGITTSGTAYTGYINSNDIERLSQQMSELCGGYYTQTL